MTSASDSQAKQTYGQITWRWWTPGWWGNPLIQAKDVFWRLTLFNSQLLLLLWPFSPEAFTFNVQKNWCNPGEAGYPTLKRSDGKIWPRLWGLPGLADRATRQDRSPHLSCKHDQIKINRLRSWFTAHFTVISPHAVKKLLNMFSHLAPVGQKMDSAIHQIAITQ